MEFSRKRCLWVSISLCAFGLLLALFANGSYAKIYRSEGCIDICVPGIKIYQKHLLKLDQDKKPIKSNDCCVMLTNCLSSRLV